MPTAKTEYLIRTPNLNYTSRLEGIIGVEFVHGKSITTDPWIANRMKYDFGFEVVPPPPVFVTLGEHKGQATYLLVDPAVHELLDDYGALDLLPDRPQEAVFGLADLREVLAKAAKKHPDKYGHIPVPEEAADGEGEDEPAEPVKA